MTDLGERWVDRIGRRRTDDDEPEPQRKGRRRRRWRRFRALSGKDLAARARRGARRSNASQRLDRLLAETAEVDD